MNNTIAIPKLSFSPVSLSHKARYETVTADLCRDADHAFTNLYIWNTLYRQEIAFAGEGDSTRAVIRFCKGGKCHYLYPVGRGPLAPVIEALRQETRQNGQSLTFVGVTEEGAAELSQLFPDEFETTETRDIAYYLYDAESLATLAGKKLHGKRNHINAFTAAHQWEVLPLTPEHFEACRQVFAAWATDRAPDAVAIEQTVIERAFGAFEALGLEGALLMADGAPAAFTLGSMVTADTLCVHVEKATPEMSGAFPVINREFVRLMREKHPALAIVNREDDMGLENLRKAKMSYRPAKILTKYTLLDISPKTTNNRPL